MPGADYEGQKMEPVYTSGVTHLIRAFASVLCRAEIVQFVHTTQKREQIGGAKGWAADREIVAVSHCTEGTALTCRTVPQARHCVVQSHGASSIAVPYLSPSDLRLVETLFGCLALFVAKWYDISPPAASINGRRPPRQHRLMGFRQHYSWCIHLSENTHRRHAAKRTLGSRSAMEAVYVHAQGI